MAEEKIGGKFVIESTLGKGGMGVVYKCFDPMLEQHRAIKVMKSEIQSDEGSLERFFVEARTAVKLRHKNIVSVIDMNQDPVYGPYIVMEYIDGTDLTSVIRDRQYMQFEQKLRIVVSMCEGLDHAHRNGVVHRDVKPANVMLTQSEEVKILDFGIAKIASKELTRTGMFMGSPYYMSPEQARGRVELDGRSDLWATGVILYELVANRRPFEADDYLAILHQIASERQKPLTQVRPGCSQELSDIVDKLLEKDRDDRFPDGKQVSDALNAFLNKLPQEVSRIKANIEDLRGRLDETRRDFENAGTVLDPSWYEVEEPAVDPDDYGNLLDVYVQFLDRVEQLELERTKIESLGRCREFLKEGKIEACEQELDVMLTLNPNDTEVMKLYEECQRQLEEQREKERRKEEIESLLQTARTHLKNSRYSDAVETADEILGIDSRHGEALKIKESAQEKVELEQNILSLLEQATHLEKSGDLEACLQACSEGLRLASGHQGFREIQDRAGLALERQRRVGELLNLADTYLHKKDYDAALNATKEALLIDPSDARARQLQTETRLAQEKEEEVARLLSQAERSLTESDFTAVSRQASRGLELAPGNAQFQKLLEQATDQLERARTVDQLLLEAENAQSAFDFGGAAGKVEEALSILPESRKAQELKAQIERARRDWLDQRIAETRRLLEEHQYRAACDAAEKGLSVAPGNDQLQRLLQAAEGQLAKEERLEQLLAEATNRLAARDFRAVLDQVSEAQKLVGEHPRAAELERAAREGLERQGKIEKLLQQAEEARTARKFEECARACSSLLELDPENRRALELQASAEKELTRLREIQQALEEARGHLQSGRFKACCDSAQKGLSLDRDHPELQELYRKAEEQLEVEERVDRLLTEARTAEASQDYRTVVAKAQDLLRLVPGHPEAKQLEKTGREGLQWQAELEKLLTRAEAFASGGNYRHCAEVCTKLLELAPEHDRALQLQEWAEAEIRREEQVQGLVEQAQGQLKAGQFQACCQTAQQGLELDPEHPELKRLLQNAEQQLELEERINGLLQDARSARDAFEFNRVFELAAEVQRLHPGNAQASQLEKDAREGQRKLEEVDQLLDKARGLGEKNDLKGCISLCKKALDLLPEFPDAVELQKWAREELDRQEKVEKLASAARRELQEGKAKAALKSSTEGLRIDPANPELAEFKKRAEEKIAEQRPKQLMMMGGAAAAVLVVIIAVAAYSFWPEAGPETDTGTEVVVDQPGTETQVALASGQLILSVSPWANVDSIRHKEGGAPVELQGSLVTPCSIPLESGEYLIQVSNPNFGSLDIEVSIQSGEASRVHRVLPRFDLDQELADLEKARQ